MALTGVYIRGAVGAPVIISACGVARLSRIKMHGSSSYANVAPCTRHPERRSRPRDSCCLGLEGNLESACSRNNVLLRAQSKPRTAPHCTAHTRLWRHAVALWRQCAQLSCVPSTGDGATSAVTVAGKPKLCSAPRSRPHAMRVYGSTCSTLLQTNARAGIEYACARPWEHGWRMSALVAGSGGCCA